MRPECIQHELMNEVLGPGSEGASLRLGHQDLAWLSTRAWPELARLGGLTRARARRLAACFELGRRVERARMPARPRLSQPGAVAGLLAGEVRGAEQESFHALLLDGRHRLLEHVRVSLGTLASSIVHPRDVFRPALRASAAGLVVAHNHPSGDPEPSTEDIAVTRRLEEAGRMVGIPVLDHVVLGRGTWVSLRERGVLRGGGGEEPGG